MFFQLFYVFPRDTTGPSCLSKLSTRVSLFLFEGPVLALFCLFLFVGSVLTGFGLFLFESCPFWLWCRRGGVLPRSALGFTQLRNYCLIGSLVVVNSSGRTSKETLQNKQPPPPSFYYSILGWLFVLLENGLSFIIFHFFLFK